MSSSSPGVRGPVGAAVNHLGMVFPAVKCEFDRWPILTYRIFKDVKVLIYEVFNLQREQSLRENSLHAQPHTHKLTKCMLNHASLCCHMHLTMQPIIYCRLILVPYSVGTCTLPCFIVIKGKRLKTVVVCGTTEDKRAQRRRNIQ